MLLGEEKRGYALINVNPPQNRSDLSSELSTHGTKIRDFHKWKKFSLA